MKKLCALIVLVCFCSLICSCNSALLVETSSSSNLEMNSYSESTLVQDYSISPINTTISFDEIVNVWSEYLNVDFETSDGMDTDDESVLEDYSISYQTDFQSVLIEMRRSDKLLEEMFGSSYISNPWCFLRGTETDYHIMRFLQIEGLRVYEYEESEWAESAYREAVNSVGAYYNETIDSSLQQGYCFVYDYQTDHSRFFATYLLNDCIISYSCSINDGERYDLYCNLCDELNLPTSEVGTELIHVYSE